MATKKVAATKKENNGKVKMYWTSPFYQPSLGTTPKVFGHPATKDENGYMVVELSKDQMKNELKRTPARMLTEKEYDLFIQAEEEQRKILEEEEEVEE